MDFCAERIILTKELIPLIIEQLESGGRVQNLTFRGTSMLPMLRQDRDTVELSPAPTQLKKYDLPLYRHPSGVYIMHRIVKLEPSGYVCLGDNTLNYEHICRDQIIGIVSAFTRDGRRICVTHPLYRLYCLIWSHTRLPRKLWAAFRRFQRRILK